MRKAIGIWGRHELARRWKALIVLGLLAGLVGGLGLAAVGGARRTETAYQRYRQATGRSDAIVYGTLLGIFDADYGPVRNLPEVEDAGEFSLTVIGLKDLDIGQLAPNDAHLYQTINRPLVRQGRLPDPRRADEILVNHQAAEKLGLHVGDRVTIVSSTEVSESVPLGSGPSVEATVVGVGDSVIDLSFFGEQPGFVPSAALLADRPEIPRATNLVVRLRPGTDVATFGRRAAEAMGMPNLPVRDLAEDTKRVSHGTDVERTALLLFAAAVALAGLVLVGQAVARTVDALAEPASALQAIGFTRPGLIAGLLLPLTVTAAAAAATTLATAIALSRWFPVGLAGRLEPSRGFHADLLVVIPGAVGVALATLGGAAIAAVRATSARSDRVPVAKRRPLSAALHLVAPLPAVIGAGLALERGDGKRALPVRPALFSGIAAVCGVIGAFGLLGGIDDALASPERSGQFWDAEVSSYEGVPMSEIVAELRSDEQVTEITVLRISEIDLEDVGTQFYSIDPVTGGRSFTLLDGRQPVADGDVVLGPATARALHRGIGDSIRIGGADGKELRVVGLGLLPQTPHFSFDQGAWMSAPGFEAVAPSPDGEGRNETALVRFRSGLPVEAAMDRIQQRLAGVDVEQGSLPQDVTYLGNVRNLPKALAGFLVLLGLGALGHVLATAVRRRRRDLAVLRAIGFRPLQLAGSVAWQAATVALVALIVGIPLGIAAGRWSWRWVADSTPILYVPPVAATVVVLSVPVTLVLANVMAALPARRAARLRPADVLRAE